MQIQKFFIIICILILQQGVSANLSASAKASLEGTLEKAMSYGPPNYGENPKTDKKEFYYLLKLKKTVNAFKEEVSELQIINTSHLDLEKYLKKQVVLKGKLFEAITGHHHTPVLIEASGIQRVNRQINPLK